MIIPLPAVDPEQARLGRRLRQVRQARGLCVEELARESGLSCARLGLGEAGRTRLTSAEWHGLISALHISLGLLHAEGVDLSSLRAFRRNRGLQTELPRRTEGGSTMADKDQVQGEGNYDAGRRYQKEQHEFAKKGPVEQKAQEAEDALDGPEAEDLERARRETGEQKPM